MRKRTLFSIVAFLVSVGGYMAHTVDMREMVEAFSTATPPGSWLWPSVWPLLDTRFHPQMVPSFEESPGDVLQEDPEGRTERLLHDGLSPAGRGGARGEGQARGGGDYFRALSALAFGVVIEVIIVIGISLVVLGASLWGGLALLGFLFLLLVYGRGGPTPSS